MAHLWGPCAIEAFVTSQSCLSCKINLRWQVFKKGRRGGGVVLGLEPGAQWGGWMSHGDKTLRM